MVSWSGIRNFQARNYLKEMEVGDLALFYHSNGTLAKPTGVYGIARVTAKAQLDQTALDPHDQHFDAKAVVYEKAGKEPLWVCPKVTFVEKFIQPLSLTEIKNDQALVNMLVAKRGQRLSVMPVEQRHFQQILKKGGLPERK